MRILCLYSQNRNRNIDGDYIVYVGFSHVTIEGKTLAFFIYSHSVPCVLLFGNSFHRIENKIDLFLMAVTFFFIVISIHVLLAACSPIFPLFLSIS